MDFKLLIALLLGVGTTVGDPAPSTAPAPKPKVAKVVQMEMPARRRGVPERIIRHTGFTVSFNREHNAPNYVAWELTSAEAKSRAVERLNDFQPDPDVPEQHRVTTADYRGCGYDRGHMAPAADMRWSRDAMRECFYMSNICPQNHSLNAGSWQELEDACRRWAETEGKVYIVCGPVYRGQRHKHIGSDHRVTVPEAFFKVVMSNRSGHEKAIGFIYNNTAASQNMESTAMTVDEVERITGYNFFVNLPKALERRIEATCSLTDWR